VRVGSLECKVVHGSFEHICLSKLVLLVFIEIYVLDYEVIILHISLGVHIHWFEVVLNDLGTDCLLLSMLKGLVDQRQWLLAITI
jgi:hypothetical protein